MQEISFQTKFFHNGYESFLSIPFHDLFILNQLGEMVLDVDPSGGEFKFGDFLAVNLLHDLQRRQIMTIALRQTLDYLFFSV